MKNITPKILLYLLLLALVGCGALETARFYTAVPNNEAGTPTARWGDGIAFVTERMCIWVAEGSSKDYRVLSMGPIGLPIIPAEVFSKERAKPGFFDLVLWFIPDQDQQGFTFDPSGIVVSFDNGEVAKVKTVQISRFKTRWVDQKGLFRSAKVERIYDPEHWGVKAVDDIRESVELWDWSRFILHFEKPIAGADPVAISITGLTQHGKQQPITELSLIETKETRYVHSGKTGDNTWIGDSQGPTCRELLRSTR